MDRMTSRAALLPTPAVCTNAAFPAYVIDGISSMATPRRTGR